MPSSGAFAADTRGHVERTQGRKGLLVTGVHIVSARDWGGGPMNMPKRLKQNRPEVYGRSEQSEA